MTDGAGRGQTDNTHQEAGERGANVRIEITEGVAKWLSIVLALMFFASLIGGYLALDKAGDAKAIAAAAEARAQTAEEDAARAQRQADLANWTVNNLEGIMTAHGIAVPENLRPHNLTRGGKK